MPLWVCVSAVARRFLLHARRKCDEEEGLIHRQLIIIYAAYFINRERCRIDRMAIIGLRLDILAIVC